MRCTGGRGPPLGCPAPVRSRRPAEVLGFNSERRGNRSPERPVSASVAWRPLLRTARLQAAFPAVAAEPLHNGRLGLRMRPDL